MRKATLLAAWLSLLLAAPALGDPSITLVWTRTTGSGTSGGGTMAADTSDSVVLQVFVDPDANGLSFIALSFDYDPALLAVTDYEECPTPGSTPPGGNLVPANCNDPFFTFLYPIVLGMTDDPVAGRLSSAEATTFQGPGSEAHGTIELAAIEFQVLAPGDTTVDVGYVPGLDSVNDANGDVFFPSASATLLPEPGAPLALGAGALLLGLLARRGARRRSRLPLLAAALLLIATGAAGQDADGDGVLDADDNCLLEPNAPPLDCDTDMDGYGNACDADYNDDGIQGNLPDGGEFGTNYGLTPANLEPDHNCDGVVGGPDHGTFFPNVGVPPGPSGLACAGTPPCP